MEQQENSIHKAAVKIVVSGYVQGVGYRYFIARNASDLELTGYAKNLFNGDVEIYAEGKKQYLDVLVSKAKTGPPHAVVDKASVEWLDFKNKYDNFEIR
jgi:acylphosphatase